MHLVCCVFELLLNLVAPLSKNGYNFKEISVILHDQAFADDISITASTPKLAQQSIDVLVRFLEFHLQANAKKCISMATKSSTQEMFLKFTTPAMGKLSIARTILN